MAETKKSRRMSKTTPRAIALTEKRAEALEYRKQGYSYSQIGESMGFSAQYAHELVDGALKAMIREPAESIIAMELARLDDMMTAVYGPATKGELMAVDRVVKLGERRAKILGLDAPEKAELSGELKVRTLADFYGGDGETEADA